MFKTMKKKTPTFVNKEKKIVFSSREYFININYANFIKKQKKKEETCCLICFYYFVFGVVFFFTSFY